MTEGNENEKEEFYVVARILEASAKSEGATSIENAAVYARAAEMARDERDLRELTDALLKDADTDEAEQAVEHLRLATKEIETDGRAAITERADDAVVACLRSEYD